MQLNQEVSAYVSECVQQVCVCVCVCVCVHVNASACERDNREKRKKSGCMSGREESPSRAVQGAVRSTVLAWIIYR